MRRRLLLAVGLGLLAASPLAAQRAITPGEADSVLSVLSTTYGPSGMEAPVRAAVQRLLPDWARPTTDTAGNLWVKVGTGEPVVVFVAHLDEIGYTVTGITDDGRLELRPLGGFLGSLFEARPALVHTGKRDIPGVFTPRDTTTGPRAVGFTVDLGTRSRAATEALGVGVGSSVTMPKDYAHLAGTRATARSFDDRVGCTALILALRHLDRGRLRHQVIFIFSVREEVGLDGARAAAAELGLGAARVHAVDTFVSADSPLELPNFALAPLGRGPVIRAVDNSAVAPRALVDTLLALAGHDGLPLQLGGTNGGNDGSAFAPWGVPDVALGWPLRYSHSPAEVSDLRDVAGLAAVVRAIAEEW